MSDAGDNGHGRDDDDDDGGPLNGGGTFPGYDPYKALTRDDLTDEKLLLNRFDFLRLEVGELNTLIRGQLLPAIERMSGKVDDASAQVKDLATRIHRLETKG